MGCHKSTISRELKRGTVTQRKSDLTEYRAYFPETGQAVYKKNRSRCGAKYQLVKATAFVHFAVKKMQLIKIEQKTAVSVHQVIQSLKDLYREAFPSAFKTITSDNGSNGTVMDFYRGLTIGLGEAPTHRKVVLCLQMQQAVHTLFRERKVTPVFILDEMHMAKDTFPTVRGRL